MLYGAVPLSILSDAVPSVNPLQLISSPEAVIVNGSAAAIDIDPISVHPLSESVIVIV